jgi:fucose 4-O-acetylase-like acetyltransferase
LSSGTSGGRTAFLDNARFVLITLVVIGHFLEPFVAGSPPARAAYLLLYAFHMPLFAALSGRVSSAAPSPGGCRRLLARLLVPYLVFQVLLVGFDRFVLGGSFPLTVLRPYWVLWFLVSLLTWRLLLPYLPPMRWALPVSLALALAVGAAEWIGYELSLSRTLVFLPFFLLGHATRTSELERLARFRWPALGVLVGAAVSAWMLAPGFDLRTLYGSHAYAAVGSTLLDGALLRAGLFAAAAILSLAFLAWIPHRETLFTPRGARTLTVLVLHAFVVRGLGALGAFELLDSPVAWAVVGLAVAVLLSNRTVDAAVQPLLAPALPKRSIALTPQ